MLFLIRKFCIVLIICSLWGQQESHADNINQEKVSSLSFHSSFNAEESVNTRILVERSAISQVNGDYNEDGKVYPGILWWLTGKNNRRNIEYEPQIESFTASLNKILIGEKTRLKWNVDGFPESLIIDNGVGDVTNQSSVEVNPSRTTTYTLTASNSKGTATAQVTVEVIPKIVSFTASPNVIRNEGETSRLRWQISGNYTCVKINHDVGEVTGKTNVRVASSGVYTLRVFYSLVEPDPCSGPSIQQQVTVHSVPKITFFRAKPSAIGYGATATLSWSVQGEDVQISVDQGFGDVSDLTEIQVYPERTTIYTLTAFNDYGRVVKTAKVEVLNLPVIESFTASRPLINSDYDDDISLRWEVSGSGSFQLNVKEIDSDGNQKEISSCKDLPHTRTSCLVFPRKTTSYILTASNSIGVVESEIIRIDMLNLNTPDPSSIIKGQSSLLSWEGSESAEVLQLTKREGQTGRFEFLTDVTGEESYEVFPRATTYYQLKARHYSLNQFVYSKVRSVQVGEITSFSASPPFVVKFDNSDVFESTKRTEGETQLRWSLVNIDNPQISMLKTVNGRETDISSSCESSGCRVTPDDTTTTYTLRVRNGDDDLELTKQTRVDVLKIGRFKGSTGSGESIHRNCVLTNTEQRALSESNGDVELLECLTVTTGQSADLFWTGFSGYSSLTLRTCRLDTDHDSVCTSTSQTVTGLNRIRVNPSGHSSEDDSGGYSIYTLLAEKQTEGHSKTIKLRVKVTVQNKAQVNTLNADDRIIGENSSDQTTRLSWNISGRDPINFTLKKHPEGSSQTDVFSRTSPRYSKQSNYTYSFAGLNDKKTTEFTLTADNNFGSESSKTVKVYYLKIGSFTAVADSRNSTDENCSGADHCLTTTSGTEVTLNWSGIEGFGDETSSCSNNNPSECIMDTLEITASKYPGVSIPLSESSGSGTKVLGSSGRQIERAPTSTTTYTLTAKKQVGSETESISKTVKIIVQDAPEIYSFTSREGSVNTSTLNRILDSTEADIYLHYTFSGKPPLNIKLEQKPYGENRFSDSEGAGFNSCSYTGGGSDLSCTEKREVTGIDKTTEYKLTVERTSGNRQSDTRTLKVYKLGIGRFKAQVRRNGENIGSCNAVPGDDDNCVTLNRSTCTGADECLTVTHNERITFSWSGVTGFEDERSGDSITISDNDAFACSSSSYQDDSNPSKNGSVTFSSSGTAGVCNYTLTIEKTLGSGDNADTDSVTKTIKVSVNNPVSIDYFESRTSSSRTNNTNINRIIQNSGSTILLWKIFSFTQNDTYKLKSQKEGGSLADFETISPSCTDSLSSPSYVECSYIVSSINKTTTYTLEATSTSGGQKVTSSPLKVYVLKIGNFKGQRGRDAVNSSVCPSDTSGIANGEVAECISIEQGNINESVRLRWEDVEGFGGTAVDTLEIEADTQTGHGLSGCTGTPCKRNIKGQSQLTVRPTATTIYTLIAKKMIGMETVTVAKKVKVTLESAPSITTFDTFTIGSTTAQKAICTSNCTFDLYWVVQNANKVTMSSSEVLNGVKSSLCVGTGTYPECQDLSNGGNTLTAPAGQRTVNSPINQTTQYCLKAENTRLGLLKRICTTVKVFRIVEFKAVPTCVSSGGASTLSWKVAEGINGANSVSLDNSIGSKSSNCVTSHNIETICSGTHILSSLSATNNYILTAKKPSGIRADLTSSSVQVEVSGSCTSSARSQKKVSSVLQDCQVCPRMAGWGFFNGSNVSHHDSSSSSSSSSSYSLDQQIRRIGTQQSDVKPNLQKIKNSLNGDTREENLVHAVVEKTDSDLEKRDSTSQEKRYFVSDDKITHSQYQACVDEGFCSSVIPFGESLSSSINEQTQVEESYSLSQDGLQSMPLQEFEVGHSFQEDSFWSENEEIKGQPVALISLSSAMQYAQWLSEKTGKSYGVLADPTWADGIENSSTEDFKNFTSLSPLYNRNGVLLYAVHSKELQSSAAYDSLIESLLGSEQVETLQSSDISAMENERAFDSNNHSSAEVLSPNDALSQGTSSMGGGVIFRSGFHVVRPL